MVYKQRGFDSEENDSLVRRSRLFKELVTELEEHDPKELLRLFQHLRHLIDAEQADELSGVTAQQIRRFVGGERDLQLVNAGKLALALGLEFSPIK